MRLTLGLVPLAASDETRRALQRVADAIEAQAGLTCGVFLAESPAALAEAFHSGLVNVAWSSPTLVLTRDEFRGAVPVVTSVREGQVHYHGVLFVRRESELRSVMDLRGARAAWVADSSSSGYIFPRLALANIGLHPDDLLGSQRFLGSHGAVVEAVLADEADVGAVYAAFENGDCTRPIVRSAFSELGRLDEVQVLLPSAPIPSDVIVLERSVSAHLGASGVEVFTGAAARAPEAFEQVLGTRELVACRPEQFAELRRHVHHARELGVIESA